MKASKLECVKCRGNFPLDLINARCPAGVARYVEKGLIPRDARVVTVVTGSGLKYPPVLKEFDLPSISTSLDQLVPTMERLIK